MTKDERPREGPVRPGAILRAMGASDEAIESPPVQGDRNANAPRSTPAGWGVASVSAWEPTDARQDSGRVAHPAQRIEVVRDGGRVARILAHCRCGETITIACEYDAANVDDAIQAADLAVSDADVAAPTSGLDLATSPTATPGVRP